MTETVDLWMRDILEVIKELVANSEFSQCTSWAPYQELEVDEKGETTDRFFEDMPSADWWWEVQVRDTTTADQFHPEPVYQNCLPEKSMISPVILASDKTQLTPFSGDKQAWPVYLTIGNIDKNVRRSPSRRAMVLLGYLPAAKLQCFPKGQRSLEGYRLFHYAMSLILAPLIEAGEKGEPMVCSDGWVRHVHPILAAYMADYPEQCLVACCKENRCPTCLVSPNDRGELLDSCYRDPGVILEAIRAPSSGPESLFKQYGLRDIPEPFWAKLPYANIFACITPDMLHQLHKGVFKDHLFQWATTGVEAEVDARYMRYPPYQNLRVFVRELSTISQWTGNEYRQMEKTFVGILAGCPQVPREVVAAARALLDFIYLAHFPIHSVASLQNMRRALEELHKNKVVFVRLGIRLDFNIPKFHWLQHYIISIIRVGSTDAFSTDLPERLHIDFAKQGYRASSRKAYIKQMIVWLTRREKMRRLDSYLRWVEQKSEVQIVAEMAAAAAQLDLDHSADQDWDSSSDESVPGEDSDSEMVDSGQPEVGGAGTLAVRRRIQMPDVAEERDEDDLPVEQDSNTESQDIGEKEVDGEVHETISLKLATVY